MISATAVLLFFLACYVIGQVVVRNLEIGGAGITAVLALIIGAFVVTGIFFGVGHLIPLGAAISWMVLVSCIGLGLVGLGRTGIRQARKLPFRRLPTVWLVGASALLLLLIWLFGRALLVGPQGEIIAGDRLVWVDWPLHITMATNFAYGANFPPQNPTFAGIPLIYPFMADFLSGILLTLGSTVFLAFAVPGVVLTFAFFLAYLWLVKAFFAESALRLRDQRKLVAPLIALIVSLFWGGLGWVYWLQEVAGSPLPLATLLVPPREYTFWGEKGLWFFTFLFSEILPQRAFLFGLPLFFAILILVKIGWEKRNIKVLSCAGLLAGATPFFHTHTFLSLWFLSLTVGALLFIGQMLFVRKHFTRFFSLLFAFFVPFGLLSLAQLPLFLGSGRQIPFEFGWLKGADNFFWFWFKNTGFFIPLALLGLLKGKWSSQMKVLGIASWILFILPNLFRFAPWAYDNLKIFTFWYLLTAPFAVMGLFIIARIKWVGRALAIFLLLSLILSGLVEVGRLFDTSRVQITLWSKSDQVLAQMIREKTEPNAVFLTAAIHDHPVAALAGRKIVIGFPGNSWSWGIADWSIREQDVHTMFRGGAAASRLWKKYGIDYIIVSDRERGFESGLDEEFIREHTRLYFTSENTTVYKLN